MSSTATSTTTVMEVVGERKKSASLPIERILYPQRYYTQEMRLFFFFNFTRHMCLHFIDNLVHLFLRTKRLWSLLGLLEQLHGAQIFTIFDDKKQNIVGARRLFRFFVKINNRIPHFSSLSIKCPTSFPYLVFQIIALSVVNED